MSISHIYLQWEVFHETFCQKHVRLCKHAERMNNYWTGIFAMTEPAEGYTYLQQNLTQTAYALWSKLINCNEIKCYVMQF